MKDVLIFLVPIIKFFLYFFLNENDNCTCYISTAKMIECKHRISINRKIDISKIDKCWYKRKGLSLLSNYGPFSSPKIYTFDCWLDYDEDNFEIFDNNYHNDDPEIECTFDDNLVNIEHPDEYVERIDNNTTDKSTNTLIYTSISSICDELHTTTKMI